MEVHHHAHTDRKKWTHYLWEFLMLFLAVFCGFLGRESTGALYRASAGEAIYAKLAGRPANRYSNDQQGS